MATLEALSIYRAVAGAGFGALRSLIAAPARVAGTLLVALPGFAFQLFLEPARLAFLLFLVLFFNSINNSLGLKIL